MGLTLLILIFAASTLGLAGPTGCSSGSSTPALVTTPAGTYSIGVAITATNANAPLTLPLPMQESKEVFAAFALAST